MSIPDVLNQPWAITREKYDTICAVYERHLAGEKLDAAGIQAAIVSNGSKPAADAGYTVQDGVAVIPVQGVLAKKMNLFTSISGGMSTQMLADAITQAVADPSVHSLMLAIDSPGGEVDGTQQVADAVAQSTKPTAASVDGMACSAAMWIAAMCNSIWAASDTTELGSIAVVMTHTDRSKANEARGVKPTHITTGKYKRILASDSPLSQDGLAYAQDKVDYLHTLFINAVAEGRDLSPDAVDAMEGQTFYAQQAVENGLIDGIASEDEVIGKLVSAYQARLSNPASAVPSTTHPKGGAMSLFKSFATEAEFRAEIQAAEDRGKASATVTATQVDAARTEGIAAGATAERERISAIDKLPLAANHAALVSQMKADGTSAIDAQGKILAAEGSLQARAGADRKSEAQAPVVAGHADAKTEAAAVRANEGGTEPRVITAGEIQAQIAKAKAEGRSLGTAQALAELRTAK